MAVKKKKDDFVELNVVHKKTQEPQVVARVPKDVEKPKKDKDIGKKINELKQLTEKIKLEKEDDIKTVKKKVLKKILPAPVKTDEPVGDVLKTNIDRLYDLVKLKKVLKVRTAARVLKVTYDMTEEWARVLEDNKMVRLHYPTFGEPLIMLKKPKKKGKKKGVKVAKKKKPAFFFNIIIIVVFVIILAIVLGIDIPGLQDQSLTTYLIIGAVVIVVLFMAMKFMKRKNSKVIKTENKKDEHKTEKTQIKHEEKKEVKHAERKKDS